MIASATLFGALATAPASPSPEDRRDIALSRAIVRRVGDRIWPNWSKTPFAIDLLTARGPVAIDFPKPLAPPSFPRQLEAAFPLANGVPTIVIGERQFTAAKTATRWSVTLIHEHFHQWQYSWPAYEAAITGLALAPKSEKNAMWMLNYPFPYEEPRIDRLYNRMATSLAAAVTAIGSGHFKTRLVAYLGARGAFRRALKPNDYRYFAFQCWQEGVARYTEITVARSAAEEHKSDSAFLTDTEARALLQDSAATYASVVKQLRSNSLASEQRTDFYALGAGEALLLDQANPEWRRGYLDKRMDLGVYF